MKQPVQIVIVKKFVFSLFCKHHLFRGKEIILHLRSMYNFSLFSCIYVNVLKCIVISEMSKPILNASFKLLV